MTALFTLMPEAVGTIDADSKQAILEQLAQRFAGVYGLDPTLVLERIEEREKLGSTGFGRGVAIPHARIPDLHRPVGVFLRLANPVAFDAADGMPVNMVFGLLSPEAADRLIDAGVDKDYRAREKASDHAPTWITLA